MKKRHMKYGRFIRKWWKFPAARIISIFLVIALFHPFIANERPLLCKLNGKVYTPIIRNITTNWGLTNWYNGVDNFGWMEKTYESKIMPLIPYSYNTIDTRNPKYKSPFAKQNIDNIWQRHWLGTDALGRDVLAGILKGTEIAVRIGFTSVFIACIIALILGLTSAFSVRFPIRINTISAILIAITIISNGYYLWYGANTTFSVFFIQFLIWVIIWTVYIAISRKLNLKRQFIFPFDKILIRLLEAMKSVPSLIFILACLTLFQSFSVNGLIAILAFIMWPSFTRYIRADALKILNMDYITAAKGYGASNFRILWKHVRPKVFTSLSVLIVFAIASAIIVESTLSFLGIGLPLDQVSWGSLLKEARLNFNAWWLAVFPGIAMFILILALNLLGEQIQKGKEE